MLCPNRRALLLTLILSVALLAPSQVEWVWEAPPGCGSQQAVERRFMELAPETCRAAATQPLQVRAVASRDGRLWRLDLALRRGDRSVTRSLEARGCAALVETVAVIAATACPELREGPPIDAPDIDPHADEATDEATPEAPQSDLSPGPDPHLRPDPEPVANQQPRPAAVADVLVPTRATDPLPLSGALRPRRSRAGLELGARLAAAWGPTPAPALLAGAALRLRWPALDLLLALDGGPRRRAPAGPGLGIDLRLVTATVAGCPAVTLGAGPLQGRLSLCLGLEAGVMTGTGVGTEITRTATQPWLAALLGTHLVWSVHSRLGIGVAIDLTASITRPAFILDGYAFGFRASALSVRGRTMLIVRLR